MMRLKLEMETTSKEFLCAHCRCENRVLYCNGGKRVPSTICRCCGLSKRATESLQTTATPSILNLDQKVVKEWNDLIQDIDQNPEENTCGQYIDSCPMIQKLFLMMKYYHIYIGKKVVGSNDEEEYRIDSMTGLVKSLPNISLTELVDIFEHVSAVHRDPKLFEHFMEGIGRCDHDAACDIVHRFSGRTVVIGVPDHVQSDAPWSRSRPRVRREEKRKSVHRSEEELDVVEQHTLSFFVKWHRFLFHSKVENDVATPSIDEVIGKMHSMPRTPRRISSKYVDYGFGVWIDYTAHSPFFDSMRDEMIGNEIHQMTPKQWESTLMDGLTHLDSEKITVGDKYTAKITDEKYGIVNGQKIGIENVMAILIYCNYTELQTRFSETFRKMEEDDDEVIADKHCRNYYWFGRCVLRM